MRILVMGMHRSGTSLAAQLVHKMGTYAGGREDLLPATRDNQKGYLERKDVVDLNEYALNGAGNKWYEVSDFDPSRIDRARRQRFDEEARRIVSHLNAHGDWLLKDPRMCITLPLWAPIIKDHAVIFVHRDPVSVAKPLKKRDLFPVFFSLALWEMYTVSALNFTSRVPRLFVRFQDLVACPAKTGDRVYNWLDSLGSSSWLRPAESEVTGLVDRGLVNHAMTPEELDRLAPPQLTLHNRLVEMSGGGAQVGPTERDNGTIAVSEGSIEILRYYESVNRIERIQRSRSKTLTHLWKLIRGGKPGS